jgi:hypothetical protein
MRASIFLYEIILKSPSNLFHFREIRQIIFYLYKSTYLKASIFRSETYIIFIERKRRNSGRIRFDNYKNNKIIYNYTRRREDSRKDKKTYIRNEETLQTKYIVYRRNNVYWRDSGCFQICKKRSPLSAFDNLARSPIYGL